VLIEREILSHLSVALLFRYYSDIPGYRCIITRDSINYTIAAISPILCLCTHPTSLFKRYCMVFTARVSYFAAASDANSTRIFKWESEGPCEITHPPGQFRSSSNRPVDLEIKDAVYRSKGVFQDLLRESRKYRLQFF